MSLSLAAPAPALSALSACSGIQLLRLSDASMLSNRITGMPAFNPLTLHSKPEYLSSESLNFRPYLGAKFQILLVSSCTPPAVFPTLYPTMQHCFWNQAAKICCAG